MTLTRFNPFLAELGRLNRLFGRDDVWEPEETAAAAEWIPAVDILDGENEIVLKAELPGVAPKDIVVNLDNNILTLKGERRSEKEVKKENYYRLERAFGTFSRSFTLPGYVDAARVKADYKDGVLSVVIPKKETAKTRTVEVKAA